MALLDIKNLNFKYSGSNEFALQNINISINKGEFTVICGESGCGKSTLLKLIKRQLSPKGEKSGTIHYSGIELSQLDERTAACDIGFVMQNPESQIVTEKVWHELAFGLESLGEKTPQIRRRAAEISGYFGITAWYHKRTDELSGGQKQLLNLASVMAMNPKILILDEPTSQLDPIAAGEFIATLKKLNNELGLTIILVEHRLEEIFPIADKVIVMNKAGIIMHDAPNKIVAGLNAIDPNSKMNLGLPTAVRIYRALKSKGDTPITVKEGKNFLASNYKCDIKSLEQGTASNMNMANVPVSARHNYALSDIENTSAKKAIKNVHNCNAVIEDNSVVNINAKVSKITRKDAVDNPLGNAVELSEAWFRYERNQPDILSSLDLNIRNNEILCILGANGAGKTTLLNIINGTRRIYRGKLRIFGRKLKEYTGVSLYRNNVASLPQNPQLMFVKNKLYDDLAEVTTLMGLKKEDAKIAITNMAKKLGISELLTRHPFDLSGGEQQKAAFAKIMLLEPKLLLLDEPTKGIDAYSKIVLADILYQLKGEGKTIVIVTHDVEFAAEYADRCAMFFDGQIVSIDKPEIFFSDNSYYTTSASRISRELYDGAVTVNQVVSLCRINGEIE